MGNRVVPDEVNMDQCAAVMPKLDEKLSRGKELRCLLRKDHAGRFHLIQYDDGSYALLEHNIECDCEVESCERFSYKPIPLSQAQRLLRLYGIRDNGTA